MLVEICKLMECTSSHLMCYLEGEVKKTIENVSKIGEETIVSVKVSLLSHLLTIRST